MTHTHSDGRPTSPILLDKTQGENELLISYRVPEDLYYFDGHFDGLPVVAGVCQIKWVFDAIETHFNHKLQLKRMEGVKFHKLLLPGDEFCMGLRFDKARERWHYRLFHGDLRYASGRLVGSEPA